MGKLPEILDVGLDKHTARGRAMGRDSMHFLTEGSLVIPEKKMDNNYRERYLKLLENYDPNNVAESVFKYNSWQE